MKKLYTLFTVALTCSILSFSASAQTGTWTRVKTPAPHSNMGVCLLMTDGTVICKDASGPGQGTGWDRLTPDIHGSYINGTWDTIAPMKYDRLFFSTQVLPSGQVYAAGGEYGAGATHGEFYDPVANKWTDCGPPPGGWNIYDGNSEILYDGNVLEGPQIGASPSYDCLIWSPVTNLYTIAPSAIYNHDEAPWLKLPDSSILFVGINSSNSNRYIPQTNTWVNDGTVPGSLYDGIEEAGGAFMLPNGKAIFFGATPFNAIYTPTGNSTPGTWTAAASFPTIEGCPTGQSDASSAMLVNGHILLAVSPDYACAGSFSAPCYFLEYDYTTNTFTQIKDTMQDMNGDSIPLPSYQTQMLALPDGTVLLSISQDSALSNLYYIYTPGSGPIPQGKPVLNSIYQTACGNNFYMTGKLFNGISEGASYGDDWQMATNWPLVRLTDGTNVYYAKTSNWNRIGAVQTDSLEDTAQFALPAAMPAGTYTLVVVVNGIPSSPYIFSTYQAASSVVSNVNCSGGNNGNAQVTVLGGNIPYTYAWSNGATSSATGATLSVGTYTVTVTDKIGCTLTASVTITQPAALADSASITANVRCNGGNTGSAMATASGGTAPYNYAWTSGGTSSSVNGLSVGSYTVTVTDKNGCTTTSSISITQPGALSLAKGNTTAWAGNCNGSAWVSASGGTAPYKYSWNPGGGTTDTIKGLCPSSYCCTVTDSAGCIDSVCISVVTGIPGISNNSTIKIFPNPGNGNFTVTGLNKGEKIELYDYTGQEIINTNTEIGIMQFNISDKANGIYLIRITARDGSLVSQSKILKID